jgi:uncharacterized protein YyaL (SSP411 family)
MTTLAQNHLAEEQSPYLLQHADNPVNWYPWGEAAFERARLEDKPIFLSVGYSTCHWCHVMAHESFEDPVVAALMNDAFINIKLDREERPDIDQIYMTVCQMMTGGGGWPLTILMTPDREPFFAATYIPKTTRFGRVGMLDLVPKIKQLWASQRPEFMRAAQQITRSLKEGDALGPGENLGQETLDRAFLQLERQFDRKHGGLGGAPKFPTPHLYLFLLRHWRRSGREEALQMVTSTLRAMRRGGIFDHLGTGFHRYSTDERWFVPHFEKMLYDQALLALAYLETFQATEQAEFADTAREIFGYVLRDLRDASGGFHSAEDADSEGEEGKFYVWTTAEVRQVLGDEQADLVLRAYNLDEQGNFREEASGERSGGNILHLRGELAQLAQELDLPLDQLQQRLEHARAALFEQREGRIRPGKDDKVLTDWNGLMIAALARGGRVLGEARYTEAAVEAATFALETMRDDGGRLLHRYRKGQAGIAALLDDHAFLVWGLLELYEATFEARWLEAALELSDVMIEHFWDDRGPGGFFTTADDAEALLVRQKTIYDGAIPSGNSVAMWNLLRLARISGRSDLEEIADRSGRVFSSRVKRVPSVFTQFLVGLDFAVGSGHAVVIAGDPADEQTQALLDAARRGYHPGRVVLLRPTSGEEEATITRLAPYTAEQREVEGRPTAYVCEDDRCSPPVTAVSELLELLEG